MKEKQVTKFFLACSTLVTCITLGINLTFRHAAHAVIAESGEVSPTATADFIASIGEIARQIGQERNLYASVMIAQAIIGTKILVDLVSVATTIIFPCLHGH